MAGAWLLAQAAAFVLLGENLSAVGEQAYRLPGRAYRWTLPQPSDSDDGLGGGVAWVMDPAFCDSILGQFPEQSLIKGMRFTSLSFVSCADIKDAFIRGLRTWSSNHKHIAFNDISQSSTCSSPSPELDDSCPWELYVGTEKGGAYDTNWMFRDVRAPSGVTVRGVDANWRSVMRFQTNICWYLDATFCYRFHEWEARNVDVLLVMRATLFTLCGISLLLVARTFCTMGCVLCAPPRRPDDGETSEVESSGCWTRIFDYLASLPPLSTILVIFFCVSPPVFYDRILLPCFECYDFEAAAAHEVGHVLGFGHPNQYAEYNLVRSCAINNSTCRAPFQCSVTKPYGESDGSIMHSFTTRQPRTCLTDSDLHGLQSLYPTCDDNSPQTPVCDKTARTSGWLRLIIVISVPFVIAVVMILLPLSCLRRRERRKLLKLNRELSSCTVDLSDAKQQLRDAQSRETMYQRALSSVSNNHPPQSSTSVLRRLSGEWFSGRHSARVHVRQDASMQESTNSQRNGGGIALRSASDIPTREEPSRGEGAARLSSKQGQDLVLEEIREEETAQQMGNAHVRRKR